MTWDSAAAGGVIGLLGKIVFDWLAGGRKKNGNGNTTGEQKTEYWLNHLNEIKDILKARNVVFVGIESKLTALKESTARIESRVDDAIRVRRGR